MSSTSTRLGCGGTDDAAASAAADEPRKRKTRWAAVPEPKASDVATAAPAISPAGVGAGAPVTMVASPTVATGAPAASTGLKLPFSVQAAAAAAREALEKAKKAAALQQQIQMQLKQHPISAVAAAAPPPALQPNPNIAVPSGPQQQDVLLQQQLLLLQQQVLQQQERKQQELQQEKAMLARARPLRFDALGREIDEHGNVVIVKPQVHSSLKINRRKLQDAEPVASREDTSMMESEWFDPSIPTKTAYNKRKRKAFDFVSQGFYLKQEQQMHKFHKQLEQRAQRKGAGTATGASPGADGGSGTIPAHKDSPAESSPQPNGTEAASPVAEVTFDDVIPDFCRAWASDAPAVEPWDAEYLKPDGTFNEELIGSLIEHPQLVQLRQESTGGVVNMYLTPKERKKLRRRKRQEKEREKQDKIRMGLMAPPPPKVKLSNLMRVLGDTAVADPSKVEQQVRKQMADRIQGHEQRNEERRLTPEEKARKTINKWKASTGACNVLVFRVKDLSNRRLLFKVDMNGQQYHSTGVCVVAPPPLYNVVVFEASARSAKRLRSLMLRRIHWQEETEATTEAHDEESDGEGRKNKNTGACALVWQGTVKTNSFSTWKIHRIQSDAEARRIFRNVQVEHYWEMSQKFRDVSEDL